VEWDMEKWITNDYIKDSDYEKKDDYSLKKVADIPGIVLFFFGVSVHQAKYLKLHRRLQTFLKMVIKHVR
jgi:uncharacterized membrane protein